MGFLCFDCSLYFFNLSEGLSQPQMMVVPDLEGEENSVCVEGWGEEGRGGLPVL